MDDKSLSKFLDEIAKENNFNQESKSNDGDINSLFVALSASCRMKLITQRMTIQSIATATIIVNVI